MNWLKRMYHFLGSIYLALFLIATAACVVIAGTLLEAKTESHLFAAQWTYNHPLFSVLLALFFINILFSALRRWPFKSRHIPFLMTHLGLLMIIGGTILKNYFGLQGHLYILEGSGSQRLLLPHTLALHIEKKDLEQQGYLLSDDLNFNLGQTLTRQSPLFPDLKVRLLSYTPHASAQLETWIKGQYALVSGLPPIPVQEWRPEQPLPSTYQVNLNTAHATQWNLAAIATESMSEAVQSAYLSEAKIRITLKDRPDLSCILSLEEALAGPINCLGGSLQVFSHLDYSTITGFQDPHLEVQWQGGHEKEKIHIPLQGPQALLNLSSSPAGFYKSRLIIDIIRSPLILLMGNRHGDAHVVAFDSYGRVYTQAFPQGQWKSLVVYDQGFGGYAVQCALPFPSFSSSRQDKELAEQGELIYQLQQAMKHQPPLAPPLQQFKTACDQAHVPFIQTFVQFLWAWANNPGLLWKPSSPLSSPLDRVFIHLDWNQAAEECKGCQWITYLFDQFEEPLQEGHPVKDILKRSQWPLLAHLESSDQIEEDWLTLVAQQVLSLASQLPSIHSAPIEPGQQAQLFSAYLKAYGIDYQSLCPPITQGEETFATLKTYHSRKEKQEILNEPIVLETPLTYRHRAESSSWKLEDHCPCVLVEVRQGEKKEMISLAYNNLGTGLKWPILGGMYTMRLQPQFVQLPYRLRLRQARQLNYAQSNQPYSYESDIWITSKSQDSVEATLSMNRVYETWDGFRFYLAGMSASQEGLKQVQIVVNRDPTKYLLTYPGGILVALGAILLFWRPARKKKMNRE